MIGLLVTAGLFHTLSGSRRSCALNLILFFTASWHTTPYFLGPDLVFAFAWLPFALAGATWPRWTTSAASGGRSTGHDRARSAPSASAIGSRTPPPAAYRRALLVEFAGAAVATSGARLCSRAPTRRPARSVRSSGLQGAVRRAPRKTSRARVADLRRRPEARAPRHHRQAPSLPSGAVKLGPGAGGPPARPPPTPTPATRPADIVIRDSGGSLTAFSAVCTHAGCRSATKAAPSSAPATAASSTPNWRGHSRAASHPPSRRSAYSSKTGRSTRCRADPSPFLCPELGSACMMKANMDRQPEGGSKPQRKSEIDRRRDTGPWPRNPGVVRAMGTNPGMPAPVGQAATGAGAKVVTSASGSATAVSLGLPRCGRTRVRGRRS